MTGVSIVGNSITFGSVGSYSVTEHVQDSTGTDVPSNNAVITVDSLPTISISPATSAIDAGQAVAFTNTTTAGAPTLYSYTVNSVAGVSILGNSITFGAAGSYSVVEHVKDNTGANVPSNNAVVTVSASISANAITPANPTIDSGQGITLMAGAAGGTQPYTWLWYSNVGCTVSTGVTTQSYTPSPASTTTYCVKVTDANSNTAIGTDLITVNTAPGLASLTPTNVLMDSGQSTTYSVVLSGGTGSFTVNLINVGTNTVVSSLTGKSDGTITFPANIPAAGTQTFNVVATDTGTYSPYVFASASNAIVVNSALVASAAPTPTTPR